MYTRLAVLLLAGCCGCSLIPEIAYQPRYHNPFPQLHRIAILPFFNLSESPHVDADRVTLLYYEELQAIPGFEVLPVGVVKQKLAESGKLIDEKTDFQQLAQELGVDAVLVGAVTDYSPYYPPRLGLAVRWYAANRGFHPIPPGYGLPWGTAEEEYIPDWIVWEAEFALAREQLATQTPEPRPDEAPGGSSDQAAGAPHAARTGLPADWPDPTGFVPPPPSRLRPPYRPQYEPIIRHTRIYHGNDEEFTRRLADYYFFRDDARFGGWQAYLGRSEDFVRFCCHLHITETLALRGGVREPKVVWRWPISRYDR
ncbi:MAG: hypothetical protein KatS3mg110_0367 [Pirellulaceae bacterium]|nr:MAG: hypothetical protein KatS3mg110_0367 [Pirellulaceae bacterium]